MVTGNTVIDALLWVRERVNRAPPGRWQSLLGEAVFQRVINSARKLVLITGHRRENFGQGFLDLCNAIKTLAQSTKTGTLSTRCISTRMCKNRFKRPSPISPMSR